MKIAQNNFVAGEISPELYGRNDLENYYQSAERIKNFVVKRTGGVYKRAGTELLWRVTTDRSAHYRAFPFFYDPQNYAVIVFYVKADDTTLYYQVYVPGKNTAGEHSTSVTQIRSTEDLDAFRIKQIGDTIFFTRRGSRAFKGKLDYDSGHIEWELMHDDIKVEEAPTFSAKLSGFETDPDKGYTPSTREYCLYGVRGGVMSELREKSITIYYPWIAGAKVTISFTPNWAKHDYYVLGVRHGGYYGIIGSFYPNTTKSVPTDTTWNNGSSHITTGSIMRDDVSYNITDNLTNAWSKDPNTEVTSSTATSSDKTYHSSAIAVVDGYLQGTYKVKTAPILGLKIWFGARLISSDGTTITTLGTTGNTTISLLNSSGEEIATWEKINATYSDAAATLLVADPEINSSGTYKIRITNDANDEVIVRGVVLLSDSATQTFVDNNLVAGEITGIQDPILVGDSGMDVGLVDVWEQRLVLASSTNLPFTLWFSAVGDVANFYTNRPQTMSDAFSVTIPATTATKILHTVTTRWFLLFTESGEYSVDFMGSQGFGFASITIKKTSSVGAHPDVEPVVTQDKVLFVSMDGRNVYELAYSLEQDVVKPICRTDFVPHLTENDRIKKIVYTKTPDSILYCLTEKGKLLSLTYLPDQRVFAWAQHSFGYNKLKVVDIMAPGSISVCDGKNTMDDVLLVFTCDTKPETLWIEKMRAPISTDTPTIADANCSDHIGYAEYDYPVDGESPETPVVAELVTSPYQLAEGNTMGLTKDNYDVCLMLRRSHSVSVRPYLPYGTYTTDLAQSLAPEKGELPLADEGEIALYSGTMNVLPRAYINKRGQLEIISDDGLPCEILAISQITYIGMAEEGE